MTTFPQAIEQHAAQADALLDPILTPIRDRIAAAEDEVRTVLGDTFADWLYEGDSLHDYLRGALTRHRWLAHFCPPEVLAAAATHVTDEEAGS